VQFARAGHFPWRRSLPLLACSIPASYIGGLFPVGEAAFLVLLAASLTAAGALLLFPFERNDTSTDSPTRRFIDRTGPLLGAGLGFLSGLVGIGGGIFLAPVLHLARWAPAKQVAALAAGFILVNSTAGLAGQLQKNAWDITGWTPFLALPVAVLIGGAIGARCGCSLLPPLRVRQITGAIILLVAGNLWTKLL
jgi:uncharacterized membrane protein YfcA